MSFEIDPSSDALVIVDVQNDFCPGGALGVPDGDRVVPVLNRYAARFASLGGVVFATRDWHPARTKHFKEHGGRLILFAVPDVVQEVLDFMKLPSILHVAPDEAAARALAAS